MSLATLLWSLLTFPGCGGATAMPFAPSATAAAATAQPAPAVSAARLERTGNGNWMACFGVGASGYTQCAFQGTVRNAGTGCATGIRGVARFYESGKTEIAAFPWTTDGATLTRPNEMATYRTGAVPIAIVNATAAYELTDLEWTNTACA